jgi:hypothetical protein
VPCQLPFAAAELHRPPAEPDARTGPTVEDFRRTVAEMSTKGADEFLILSYSRKGLGQTGDGHFSPMGGYNKRSDMLLVLDVARFKYMPHWVPVDTMWRAMQAIDKETGLPRGYVRMRRRASAPLLFFHLGSSSESLERPAGNAGSMCLNRRLRTSFDRSLAAAKVAITACTDPPEKAVEVFVRAFLRKSLDSLPVEEARCVDKLSKEHIQVAASLVMELEHTSIYAEVLSALTKFELERGKTVAAETVLLTTDTAGGLETPSWKAAGCHTCGVSCIRVHKAHVLTVRNFVPHARLSNISPTKAHMLLLCSYSSFLFRCPIKLRMTRLLQRQHYVKLRQASGKQHPQF